MLEVFGNRLTPDGSPVILDCEVLEDPKEDFELETMEVDERDDLDGSVKVVGDDPRKTVADDVNDAFGVG